MKLSDWIQILIYVAALISFAPVLGIFMAKVFQNQKHFLKPLLGWLENGLYRLCYIKPEQGMDWKEYTRALLIFNALGFVLVFLMQIAQKILPFNPQGIANVPWALAFNTAISFVTNTNWQAYAGETTLSYGTQMLALTTQNFLSAATGIAVFLAFTRGLVQKSSASLGNFWADTVRSCVYVLLPLSILGAVFLVSQGVVQNFSHYQPIQTLEGSTQILPMGPAASQIAIKQLGTNGGGFFNANSAHPYENPTPLSNFFQMLAILLIPAGLVFTFGVMIKNREHAWVLFIVMLVLWLAGLGVSLYAEFHANPVFQNQVLLEGKETRLGIVNSVLWATATTVASNGSVNAMHSSLAPLSGGMAMLNMMLGEIVFGGVGSGMYGMLFYILLTVFLAGMMVGRSPEYLGKKIETRDMQWVIFGVVLMAVTILAGTALACILPVGLVGVANAGPHGFSEILYAFTSAVGNNGSAFAGLNANTDFYNMALGVAILIGRFGMIIPVMLVAGNLAVKKSTPTSSGTFSTNSALFAGLLISVILLVGALNFFPALMLGPLVEHFLLMQGRLF